MPVLVFVGQPQFSCGIVKKTLDKFDTIVADDLEER